MKILWLCSQPINIIAEQLKLPKVILGGWLEGIALNLARQEGIEFFYLFPNSNHDKQSIHLLQKIHFIDFGIKGLNRAMYRSKFNLLISNDEFDVIHVFGTENKVLNDLIQECDVRKVVTSLQGIMSEVYKNNLNSIFRYHRFKNGFKQMLAQSLLMLNQRQLFQRAYFEKKVLTKIVNVIGRTEWDKACIERLNPNVKYFTNNEILREEFYNSKKWEVNSKEKYRIFVSQGSYPLKGLHFILKAMAELKHDYPEIELIIAGEDITKNQALSAKIGISYSNFIQHIIYKEELEKNVHFTGALTASQMNDELIKCHVFVIASTIENSPNALGEAMILGVPSICSKVGGITSMITDGFDGLLFESGDALALANKIRNIFDDDVLSKALSKNAIKSAEMRFDREENIKSLIKIYQSVCTSFGSKGQPGSISE